LNSRLNFRLVISNLQFHGHDLIFVSTKPAAGQDGNTKLKKLLAEQMLDAAAMTELLAKKW